MVILVVGCAVIVVLMGYWVYKKNMPDLVRRHRWYLAGPMSAVSNVEATEWREEAGRHLAVIDPVEVEKEYGEAITGDPKGLKEWFKKLRSDGKLGQLNREMQPILALDEESVADSFGLLVRIPSEPKFMWGTVKEVVLAVQAGKPVVIWCEARGLLINNTMVAMSTAVRASFDSAIKACRKIQIGLNVPFTLEEEIAILSGNGADK